MCSNYTFNIPPHLKQLHTVYFNSKNSTILEAGNVSRLHSNARGAMAFPFDVLLENKCTDDYVSL